MKGRYRIYSGSNLVAESENIITTRGRIAIGRYLAGDLAQWASALAIGSGSSTQSASDEELEMEFWREEIDLKEYSIQNGEIVLRSIIPAPVIGKVYEIGTYCTISTRRNISGSPVAVFFDTNLEQWVLNSAQEESENNRIGAGAIKLAGTSTASASTPINGTFSAYGEDDYFYLAYEVLSGSATHLTVRLKSSENDYREYNLPSVNQSDYSVAKWGVADFTVVGNPDWEDFTSVEFIGLVDGEVMLDGFAVKNNPNAMDTVLVSRTTLVGEDIIDKTGSQELQIEYALDLSVGS